MAEETAMHTLKTLLLPALLLTTACLQPVLAAEDNPPLGKMRITTRDFALTNDQRLTITHSNLARHYRVCVDAGQDAMAVSVTSDGTAREIPSGECWDFQAREIVITPAGRLGANDELLGNYQRLRY